MLNARSDWLIKLEIVCAIYLRAEQNGFPLRFCPIDGEKWSIFTSPAHFYTFQHTSRGFSRVQYLEYSSLLQSCSVYVFADNTRATVLRRPSSLDNLSIAHGFLHYSLCVVETFFLVAWWKKSTIRIVHESKYLLHALAFKIKLSQLTWVKSATRISTMVSHTGLRVPFTASPRLAWREKSDCMCTAFFCVGKVVFNLRSGSPIS